MNNTPQWKFTVPELLDLADRMITNGLNDELLATTQLRKDCLACGRILAHILLKEVIAEAIILSPEKPTEPSPPTQPE